jgi:Fe-S-cluster containining protein
VLAIHDPASGSRYTFECTGCGDCCRRTYEINIRSSDIDRWTREGREDIAKGLELDVKSIAPAAIIPLSWYETHPVPEAGPGHDPIAPERAFIEAHRKTFDALVAFIMENHAHIGTSNEKPATLVPHWFLPGLDFRAIMQPKSIIVVKNGLEQGLQYATIMAMKDACAFLDGANCSIHDTKPADCREYPVKVQLESHPRALAKFLRVCKGIRKMEQ